MEAEKKHSSAVSNVGAWAMNVISSVGLIMVNKQLMSPTGHAFAFATTLTGFHFCTTALIGLVSNATGYTTKKNVPLWELLWFSVVANTSITAMNLSLMLNSVGFYQISKLSMISVVCFLEWLLNGKHYSSKVKMAVVVVVIGVGVCTVTDVKINAHGFLCACVAVLSTSLQQILQSKLYLLLLGPFVDYFLTGKLLASYKISSAAFFFIVLSCSLAVFCNISQYLCIGRFSAVSFQVLGHMKTVCVLILGWMLFDSELTLKNILGMSIAVNGMIIYSWAVEGDKPMQYRKDATSDVKLLIKQVDGSSLLKLKDVELGKSQG
ncbi:UDP-galactose transporter 2-like [Gossypium australe]|uniref:UDP-galactose transporter 2-like n=1 Tax=Gossypium australe TaxID=47621 RepID=A0A5B6WXA7_9ROSI|nr:UDP-galactose transporter 2-like [Gossypium australe]